MYSEIQGTANQENTQNTNTNTKASNVFEIKILSKLIYFAAVCVALAGIIIMLSGVSAAGVRATYINIFGIMTPVVLIALVLIKKVPSHAYIIMITLVLSFTSAIMSFFDVIAYAKLAKKTESFSPKFNAAAAGSFFVFAAETALTVASFFTFLGIF